MKNKNLLDIIKSFTIITLINSCKLDGSDILNESYNFKHNQEINCIYRDYNLNQSLIQQYE